MKSIAAMLALMLLATPAAALDIDLRIGSVALPEQPEPLRDLRLQGRLHARDGALQLDTTRLSAAATPLGPLDGHLRLRQQPDGWQGTLDVDGRAIDLGRALNAARGFLPLLQVLGTEASGTGRLTLQTRFAPHGWQADGRLALAGLTGSVMQGRHAGEALDLDATVEAASAPGGLTLAAQADLRNGQLYVEPVFLDFGTHPAQLALRLRPPQADDPRWHLDDLQWQQAGVGRLEAEARLAAETPQTLEGVLRWKELALGPAFQTYAQPFLAGQRWEQIQLAGQASGRLTLRAGQPETIDVSLQDAEVTLPLASAIRFERLAGTLSWQREGTPPSSTLDWQQGTAGPLPFGPGRLRVQLGGRDLRLLEPLRVTTAGGALRLQALDLKHLGTPQLHAELDAQIEPLDLAQLTRALGWPVFGGQLGGRIPGVRIHDGDLEVQGILSAEVFDGRIDVEALRVLDLFGRLPRVAGDIRLRRLDLGLLTGAFAFGRIEGRLDGDVEGLRLLDWRPVAFDAHLRTPAGDRSRRRISQRAIDTLSSIGGGPTGVLSRSALGLFSDFAYARLGWRCVLISGICTMSGVEDADDGGFVLVKGQWLPRIDVVGHHRRVDWNTFVQQLLDARNSGPVQVR